MAYCSRTTARASDSNQVWKHQWVKLSKETPFLFINDLDQLIDLGINFKDVCKRLWRVLVIQTQQFGDFTPTKVDILHICKVKIKGYQNNVNNVLLTTP